MFLLLHSPQLPALWASFLFSFSCSDIFILSTNDTQSSAGAEASERLRKVAGPQDRSVCLHLGRVGADDLMVLQGPGGQDGQQVGIYSRFNTTAQSTLF